MQYLNVPTISTEFQGVCPSMVWFSVWYIWLGISPAMSLHPHSPHCQWLLGWFHILGSSRIRIGKIPLPQLHIGIIEVRTSNIKHSPSYQPQVKRSFSIPLPIHSLKQIHPQIHQTNCLGIFLGLIGVPVLVFAPEVAKRRSPSPTSGSHGEKAWCDPPAKPGNSVLRKFHLRNGWLKQVHHLKQSLGIKTKIQVQYILLKIYNTCILHCCRYITWSSLCYPIDLQNTLLAEKVAAGPPDTLPLPNFHVVWTSVIQFVQDWHTFCSSLRCHFKKKWAFQPSCRGHL